MDSIVHAAWRFTRLPVHGPRGEQNRPQNHDACVDRTHTSRLDNNNMGSVRKNKHILKKRMFRRRCNRNLFFRWSGSTPDGF